MGNNQKTVFITGATSGIGLATARLLSEHNFRLIICGRRKERLENLKQELSSKTEILALSFDVRNRQDVKTAIASLPSTWQSIDVLINNAGNAHGLSMIQDGDQDDWDAMLDINVKGLLNVSKEILPGMTAQNSGHIINIGSIAGKEVYAKGNVYCASKFAVDAITQGMRIDLNAHGIKVTGIHPGLVNTEFSKVRFKGDKEKADKVYEGMSPLYGEDVADVILFAITRPAHVQLADLVIFPTAQASSTTVLRKNS
ncbi:MAG: SDR family NAD(P)-dependent oxidoreductase [Bacteroidetes bacterium]|nr:SDR family NAD(P)-dependent oxidoreductase [Bacteroidota bacterium]